MHRVNAALTEQCPLWVILALPAANRCYSLARADLGAPAFGVFPDMTNRLAAIANFVRGRSELSDLDHLLCQCVLVRGKSVPVQRREQCLLALGLALNHFCSLGCQEDES